MLNMTEINKQKRILINLDETLIREFIIDTIFGVESVLYESAINNPSIFNTIELTEGAFYAYTIFERYIIEIQNKIIKGEDEALLSKLQNIKCDSDIKAIELFNLIVCIATKIIQKFPRSKLIKENTIKYKESVTSTLELMNKYIMFIIESDINEFNSHVNDPELEINKEAEITDM